MNKLQRDVVSLLRKTNFSYRVEIGKKHKKLFVEGKLVMVFSHGASAEKDVGHLKTILRRMNDADHRRSV